MACHIPPLKKAKKQGEMPLPSLGPIPLKKCYFLVKGQEPSHYGRILTGLILWGARNILLYPWNTKENVCRFLSHTPLTSPHLWHCDPSAILQAHGKQVNFFGKQQYMHN